MANPMLGQIMQVGFNFAPRGWSLCDGQLLPISQNQALFSLLGTTFGGDGRTSFGLPDLRSRVPVHVGTGAGLPTVNWGQKGGVEYLYPTSANLPTHSHLVKVGNALGTSAVSAGFGIAGTVADELTPSVSGHLAYSTGAISNNTLAPSLLNTGGGQPMFNRSPYLGIYYCIAMQGTFPSRS